MLIYQVIVVSTDCATPQVKYFGQSLDDAKRIYDENYQSELKNDPDPDWEPQDGSFKDSFPCEWVGSNSSVTLLKFEL